MNLQDFEINQLFFTHTGQWMCTDVGTRTITAVDYKNYLESGDKSAPYSIVEYSFDMYDMDGCWINQDDEIKNFDERLWEENIMEEKLDDIQKHRKKLSHKYGRFFLWLGNFLFQEDIMNIAQEGEQDEYALERDEILIAIPDIQTLKTLSELIASIFNESFDSAALKVDEKRYEALAEKIWIAYWYLKGCENIKGTVWIR